VQTAEHAGEAETSLMLHLHPDLVRMDRARDFTLSPEEFRRYMRGAMPAPRPGAPAASAARPSPPPEKGRLIYDRILDVVRRAVFSAGPGLRYS
jgi:creatinine amidohydrolase